jgi:hypothetical protein
MTLALTSSNKGRVLIQFSTSLPKCGLLKEAEDGRSFLPQVGYLYVDD